MKNFSNLGITAAFALPLIMSGGFAAAGGLAEPIETAAPTPVIAPAPAPMMGNDWTGFYAGAQLGYGEVDPDGIDTFDGATFGGHAGYLYDLGNIVLGAELDIDGTDISDGAVDVDAITRAKLIAGYDAGSVMPYITAGGVQARLSGALDGDDTGTFAGLGLSYDVNDSFRIGGEVLQHQFEDFDGSGLDFDVTTASLRASFKF